jgi:LmbE family N-acetylglucosaminyl deacetylase
MSATEFLPKIAMSIHAHPDDQEFTVAGTLAKWARNGCKVIPVIVTSGDAGSNDPSKGADYKPELASLREAEQSAACAALGLAGTVYLRYPDGELEATLSLRRDLTRLIRRHRPEALVIGDPQAVFYGNGYINHPDHRAAAQAALNASTSTGRRNRIRGWTSPERLTSRSRRSRNTPASWATGIRKR